VHSAGSAFQPEAWHCWPGPVAQRPSQPTPRCSAPGEDCTGERRRLHRARWDGRVLTGDDRRRRSGENGPARWCSKAAVKLRWPVRASMSPAVGGGDGG
jgi:hypothetical protein